MKFTKPGAPDNLCKEDGVCVVYVCSNILIYFILKECKIIDQIIVFLQVGQHGLSLVQTRRDLLHLKEKPRQILRDDNITPKDARSLDWSQWDGKSLRRTVDLQWSDMLYWSLMRKDNNEGRYWCRHYSWRHLVYHCRLIWSDNNSQDGIRV